MQKVLRRIGGLFVFVSTLWFILATPLLAEDIAHRRIIGFSPDGNYFAFEQSGIENGSGRAYAHIFLIDTRQNKWVKGSPFLATSRRADKLRRARQRVRRDARSALRKYRVKIKGVVLASNPITELSGDPHKVSVHTRRTIRQLDEPLVFSIREVRIRTSRCRRYTSRKIKGMIIRVRRKGGRQKILHEDKRIPKSRGCPTSYGIEDVIRLKKRGGGAVYAVIYSFIRSGAKGEERRFIAGGWHDNGGDYKEPEHYRDLYDYYGGKQYSNDDESRHDEDRSADRNTDRSSDYDFGTADNDRARREGGDSRSRDSRDNERRYNDDDDTDSRYNDRENRDDSGSRYRDNPDRDDDRDRYDRQKPDRYRR